MLVLLAMACSDDLAVPAALAECGAVDPYAPDLSQWTVKDQEKGLLFSKRCSDVAALSADDKIWGYMTQAQISDTLSLESDLYSKWGSPTYRFSTKVHECGPLYKMLSNEFISYMDDGDGVIDCQASTHYLWTSGSGVLVWAAATPNAEGVGLSVLWADSNLAPFPITRRTKKL